MLVAAIIELIIGILKDGFPEGLIEGVSIMSALAIIIVVNSANNNVSERRLAKLIELSEEQYVAVYRDEEQAVTLNAKELVVGDVYLIEQGMRVPADSILLEGKDITLDNSELTGESIAQEREVLSEENHMDGTDCTVRAKAMVCTGIGRALVV